MKSTEKIGFLIKSTKSSEIEDNLNHRRRSNTIYNVKYCIFNVNDVEINEINRKSTEKIGVFFLVKSTKSSKIGDNLP